VVVVVMGDGANPSYQNSESYQQLEEGEERDVV
jgi:hypothetical protein